MLDSIEFRIVLMAEYGFSARFIAERLKHADGTDYSVSTVYRVCKRHEIRLRDYRNGFGDEAKAALKEIDAQVRPREKMEKAFKVS